MCCCACLSAGVAYRAAGCLAAFLHCSSSCGVPARPGARAHAREGNGESGPGALRTRAAAHPRVELQRQLHVRNGDGPQPPARAHAAAVQRHGHRRIRPGARAAGACRGGGCLQVALGGRQPHALALANALGVRVCVCVCVCGGRGQGTRRVACLSHASLRSRQERASGRDRWPAGPLARRRTARGVRGGGAHLAAGCLRQWGRRGAIHGPQNDFIRLCALV